MKRIWSFIKWACTPHPEDMAPQSGVGVAGMSAAMGGGIGAAVQVAAQVAARDKKEQINAQGIHGQDQGSCVQARRREV